MAKIVKETIHAKGIDIGIYTTNGNSSGVIPYQYLREEKSSDTEFYGGTEPADGSTDGQNYGIYQTVPLRDG